jgi:AsmA protein
MWGVGAIVVLYALFFIALETVGDHYIQKNLTQAAQQPYQFDLSIGTISHSFFKPTRTKIKNAALTYQKNKVVEIERMKIDLSVLALMKQKLKITTFDFKVASLTLKPSLLDHVQQVQPPADKATSKPALPLGINRLELVDSKVEVDKATYQKMALSSLVLETKDLKVASITSLLSTLSWKATMQFQQWSHPYVALENCDMHIKLQSQTMDIQNIQCKAEGQNLQAQTTFQLSPLSDIHLKLQYDQIDLKKWSSQVAPELGYPISGQLNLHTDVRVADLQQWQQAQGQVRVEGQNIVIENINIDRLIDAYVQSNQTSLLNVAGFMALGPVGILATQSAKLGKNMPGLMQGQTKMETLHVELEIADQLAKTQDVAFKTAKHRVAAQGAIDLKEQTYQNFEIGFLDAQGCAKLVQTIEGSLTQPSFRITRSLIKTITAPVTNMTNRVENMLTGGCEKFYQGTVAHP